VSGRGSTLRSSRVWLPVTISTTGAQRIAGTVQGVDSGGVGGGDDGERCTSISALSAWEHVVMQATIRPDRKRVRGIHYYVLNKSEPLPNAGRLELAEAGRSGGLVEICCTLENAKVKLRVDQCSVDGSHGVRRRNRQDLGGAWRDRCWSRRPNGLASAIRLTMAEPTISPSASERVGGGLGAADTETDCHAVRVLFSATRKTLSTTSEGTAERSRLDPGDGNVVYRNPVVSSAMLCRSASSLGG